MHGCVGKEKEGKMLELFKLQMELNYSLFGSILI